MNFLLVSDNGGMNCYSGWPEAGLRLHKPSLTFTMYGRQSYNSSVEIHADFPHANTLNLFPHTSELTAHTRPF